MVVTVKMLVEKVKLSVIYGDEELLAKEITTVENKAKTNLKTESYLFPEIHKAKFLIRSKK